MDTPEEVIAMWDTPDKRINVINSLQSLRAHPGWIIIQKICDAHLRQFAESILDDPELPAEEEKELKLDRKRFLWFKNLPEQQVNMLTTGASEQDIELDPFEK